MGKLQKCYKHVIKQTFKRIDYTNIPEEDIKEDFILDPPFSWIEKFNTTEINLI